MRRPRLSRRILVGLDLVGAASFVTLAVVALYQPWDDGFRAGERWVDLLVVVVTAASFGLRTLAPATGLGIALGVNSFVSVLTEHTIMFYSGFVPIAFLVYAVARRHDDRLGRWVHLTWVVTALNQLRLPDGRSPVDFLFDAVMFTAVWALARAARRYARQGDALADALRRLDAERAAREREAVDAERTRIAGEMHDVVGHALSLMVLQTGAARAELAQRDDPTAGGAVEVLVGAERRGRQALDQLRASLAVLRRTSAG